MTVAEDRRAKFNMLFNAALGNKIGSTRTNYKDASLRPALEKLTYTGGGGGSSDGGGSTPDFMKKKEAPEIPEDVLELMKANKDDGKNEGTFLDRLASVITKPKEIVGEIGKGFGKAVDVISRPGYAVNSGILEAVKSINDGEPFWSLPDDVLWGAKEGITGQRKTGFGDTVAELRSDDRFDADQGIGNTAARILFFGGARGAAKASNEFDEVIDNGGDKADGFHQITKWTDRAQGLIGDVGLDPTTYLGGSAVKAIKKGADGAELGTKAIKLSAKEIAEKGGKEAVTQTLRNSAREALKDVDTVVTRRTKTPTGMWGPNKTVDIADEITQNALDIAEKVVYDVTGGAQKAKVIGGKESVRTFANAVGEGTRTGLMDRAAVHYDNFLKGVKNGTPWSSRRVAAAKQKDELFKVYHDEFEQALLKRRNMSPLEIDKAHKKAIDAVSAALDDLAADVTAKVSLGMKDALMNVPTVRMLGREVAYLPRLGKVLDKAGNTLSGTRLHDLQKAFSYSGNFPGYATLIGQKVRALGNAEYEGFRKKVIDLAQGTTKQERIDIQRALETGNTSALSAENKIRHDKLREMYDHMMLQEVANGSRKGVRKNRVNNYAYVHLQKHGPELDTFNAARKKLSGTKSFKGFTSDDALAKGLRPEQDAFKNILYKKVKSNRQLTRYAFRKDLITHYGIKANNLSPAEAARRGLKRSDQFLSDADRKALKLKPGEHLYLDQDISHVYDKYVDLAKVGSPESKEWLKALDYVTRKFKVANTVYFPGFHVRNFISDSYMGALDGVRFNDYKKILKNWQKRATADLDIGGHTVPYRDLLESYEKNAASGGFLSADLSRQDLKVTGPSAKRQILQQQPSFGENVLAHLKNPQGIPSDIRKFSENREDFGRFVHFYRAMQEEYPAMLKKYGTKEKAWDAAVNASTFRVNKYKFDYGALTKMEQQVMRRGMPFYTYMRKAIPTLAESIYLSPRNLVQTNKLFNQLAGKEEDFDGPIMLDYLRELGFLGMTGGDEPWGLSASMLPQDVFNNTFENPAASINPLARLPFEITSGKDTFTGNPSNTFMDILKNNWRGASLGKKVLNDDVDIKEKIASVAGIPLTQVTEKKQEQQLKRYKGDLRKRITQLDDKAKAKGFHIYISEKNNIKVKNYVTGEIKIYPDLDAALNAVGISP